MIGLDSNVLVRYIVQDDPQQAAAAVEIVDTLSETEPGFLSSVTWAELYWVLTRSYGFAREVVLERLEMLLLADEIRSEDAASVASAIHAARQGADFADALIAAVARRAGCSTVVTFDKRAAEKLGWRLI